MLGGNLVSCEVCSKKSDGRVCIRCVSAMSRQLEDLRVFRSDAAGNLLPSGSGDRRSSERGLGVRLDALDLVAGFDVLPLLEEWERDWRRFFDLEAFGPASAARARLRPFHCDVTSARLGESVRFLQQHLRQACDGHPAISDFARELRTLWRQSQAAAGAQPRTSWLVACPADLESGECGRSLRITGEDFDSEICCKGCGTVWPVERLLRVVASSRSGELWLDPEAAARWFGIPSRELRRWAARGRIKRSKGRYESHSIRAAISASSQGVTA